MSFNQNHEKKKEDFHEDFKFNRYVSPEDVIDGTSNNIESDIWAIGCLFVEIFSTLEVWAGSSENDMLRDLRKYYLPKINKDISKYAWGVICE